MESLFQFVAPPSQCGYLPDRLWQLEYEYVANLTPAEYMDRLLEGWRRFGSMLFHPKCPSCTACQSLRVVVDEFRPNRSQRRVRSANEGMVTLRIGRPSVTPGKLELYDRYHAFQAGFKGWPCHDSKDAFEYAQSFVDNPIPTQEWCYFIENRLVGVGYVDELPGPTKRHSPQAGPGLSAIYFFYDPAERSRSLGIWNVLCLLDRAAKRKIPYLYLGYYVAGCGSMEYKATFVPNEIFLAKKSWTCFRG